jgi:hypothetical protein
MVLLESESSAMAKKHPYDLPPGLVDSLQAMRSIVDDPVMRQITEQAERYQDQFRVLSDLTLGTVIDPALLKAANAGLQFDPSVVKAATDLLDLSRTAFGPLTLQTDKLEAFAGVSDSTRRLLQESSAIGASVDIETWRAALGPSLKLQESIGRSFDFTRITAGTLAGLDLSALGATLAVDETYRRSLASSLAAVTGSFGVLYEELKTQEDLASLPDLVIERPPREVFIHSGLLEVISIRPPARKSAPEIEDRYRDLATETEADLRTGLAPLGTPLLQMWQGARDVLRSKNPDRVRQASASLRELITQVIHTLAPDKSIRDWSTSPEHFDDKGRPTRKARLLYIARDVNRDRFSRFIDVDVAAALELIDLLQKGVHTPEAGFSEEQVGLLVLRADHLLLFLLQMARSRGN